MTVSAKIENNRLITAYNGYNGITGLADSTELCLANGFTAYTEEEVSGYFGGTHEIIDGVLTDITKDEVYIAEQKAKLIQSEEVKKSAIFSKVIDSILTDETALKKIKYQLDNSEITQAEFDRLSKIYNDRIIAKMAIYQQAEDNFYTNTGLERPTTIGA